MNPTHTLTLSGCKPSPLAHYLKSLAVLRLVAEQADPLARGYWKDERFHLVSRLTRPELLSFFLNDYQPSPVIAPWNGGSGFSPKDNTDAMEAIMAGASSRHACYRQTIATAKGVRERLGIELKVSSADEKATLLTGCRASLPDEALDWFDAAVVLLDDGPSYPPLLGTGGNDGRLDFTNNYMQRLNDVVDPDSGLPTPMAAAWLEAALYGASVDALGRKQSIGQFFPGAAGGANATQGFDADSLINPWDFVLMLEGALLFAAASSRRLESARGGAMSAPFTVRASGVGYGSSSGADSGDSRGEIWLPLWSQPSTYHELRALFSEGRVTVSQRPAQNGVDFARAVASLGVDRGLVAFERTGFQLRNGLAYFAIPLGRIPVQRNARVDLLNAIDPWLDRFFRQAGAKTAPGRVASAARQLEEAIFELSAQQAGQGGAPLLGLLLALGNAQRALAGSYAWSREQDGLKPLVLKDPRWVLDAYEQSAEFRLAAALASLRGRYGSGGDANKGRQRVFREHLEPVEPTRDGWRWAENHSRDVVWNDARPVESMQAVLKRRLILASQAGCPHWPDTGGRSARLEDVTAFIEGRIDERKFGALVTALSLMESLPALPAPELETWGPDAIYGLLKLCFAGWPVREQHLPIHSAIIYRALSGAPQALSIAARRLRASGLPPAVGAVHASPEQLRRASAALLFPLASRDIDYLARGLLRPAREQAD
ncbi:type I-U CRISPR-associated protein Csx17 [Lujinxingia litoralis]|uniref:Type I-U CRISPR-associated protein Csx17 n=1 Tax=Lujinxingia litoralis TaxID=2211119 RepID=A0A328C440_9DELT|nr:type I-U CRISPR-associated protein Csx17 [Lujinxingia litoralis]RAL21288.1 type I-U CRISPR-associated protein Csx17 [Lujinxingia litoralis]